MRNGSGGSVKRRSRSCPPDAPWWRVVRAGGHLIVAGDLRFAQIVMRESEGIELSLTVPPSRIVQADEVRSVAFHMSVRRRTNEQLSRSFVRVSWLG